MLLENKPKTAEEWDIAIKNLEDKFEKENATKLKNIKHKEKIFEEMKNKLNKLKASNPTYIYSVPIIENTEKLKKYTHEQIIILLNKGLIFDIKEVASRKQKSVAMFTDARYEESDDTYYGNIYLIDKEYSHFKNVKQEFIYNDKTGILEYIKFYVKKV